jgi:hypothetical protein
MRLVLALDPSSVDFGEKNSGGPHPYLLTVGKIRKVARTGSAVGIASTEGASVTVTLDNRGRKVTKIADRPLRVKSYIYDDADALIFSGIISSVELDAVVAWEIGA